jgi:hypothetical protein
VDLREIVDKWGRGGRRVSSTYDFLIIVKGSLGNSEAKY